MAIDFQPARFRALLHTGDVLVEVEGVINVPGRTRSFDLLSAPEMMQEVHEATVTRHLPGGIQQEIAPLITVNRDRILLATAETSEPTGESGMRIELDAYAVKLLLPGFEVAGTMRVPHGGSPYYLVTTGAGRFVALTDAVVTSSGAKPLPIFDGTLPFCVVNRSHVQVVIAAGEMLAPDRAAVTETPAG